MQSIDQPITDTMVHEFRVRNFTNEPIEKDELSCIVTFIASLDVCKVCVNQIPKLQSSFGSNLDFSVCFETKTLDIRYGKPSIVSGW